VDSCDVKKVTSLNEGVVIELEIHIFQVQEVRCGHNCVATTAGENIKLFCARREDVPLAINVGL
jgi:hypothetical protein